MGISTDSRPTVPSIPARPSAVSTAPIAPLPDDSALSPVNDDPYGQLADLDFGGGAGTGGGYETDMPRPRGGGVEEDLLF